MTEINHEESVLLEPASPSTDLSCVRNIQEWGVSPMATGERHASALQQCSPALSIGSQYAYPHLEHRRFTTGGVSCMGKLAQGGLGPIGEVPSVSPTHRRSLDGNIASPRRGCAVDEPQPQSPKQAHYALPGETLQQLRHSVSSGGSHRSSSSGANGAGRATVEAVLIGQPLPYSESHFVLDLALPCSSSSTDWGTSILEEHAGLRLAMNMPSEGVEMTPMSKISNDRRARELTEMVDGELSRGMAEGGWQPSHITCDADNGGEDLDGGKEDDGEPLRPGPGFLASLVASGSGSRILRGNTSWMMKAQEGSCVSSSVLLGSPQNSSVQHHGWCALDAVPHSPSRSTATSYPAPQGLPSSSHSTQQQQTQSAASSQRQQQVRGSSHILRSAALLLPSPSPPPVSQPYGNLLKQVPVRGSSPHRGVRTAPAKAAPPPASRPARSTLDTITGALTVGTRRNNLLRSASAPASHPAAFTPGRMVPPTLTTPSATTNRKVAAVAAAAAAAVRPASTTRLPTRPVAGSTAAITGPAACTTLPVVVPTARTAALAKRFSSLLPGPGGGLATTRKGVLLPVQEGMLAAQQAPMREFQQGTEALTMQPNPRTNAPRSSHPHSYAQASPRANAPPPAAPPTAIGLPQTSRTASGRSSIVITPRVVSQPHIPRCSSAPVHDSPRQLRPAVSADSAACDPLALPPQSRSQLPVPVQSGYAKLAAEQRGISRALKDDAPEGAGLPPSAVSDVEQITSAQALGPEAQSGMQGHEAKLTGLVVGMQRIAQHSKIAKPATALQGPSCATQVGTPAVAAAVHLPSSTAFLEQQSRIQQGRCAVSPSTIGKRALVDSPVKRVGHKGMTAAAAPAADSSNTYGNFHALLARQVAGGTLVNELGATTAAAEPPLRTQPAAGVIARISLKASNLTGAVSQLQGSDPAPVVADTRILHATQQAKELRSLGPSHLTVRKAPSQASVTTNTTASITNLLRNAPFPAAATSLVSKNDGGRSRAAGSSHQAKKATSRVSAGSPSHSAGSRLALGLTHPMRRKSRSSYHDLLKKRRPPLTSAVTGPHDGGLSHEDDEDEGRLKFSVGRDYSVTDAEAIRTFLRGATVATVGPVSAAAAKASATAALKATAAAAAAALFNSTGFKLLPVQITSSGSQHSPRSIHSLLPLPPSSCSPRGRVNLPKPVARQEEKRTDASTVDRNTRTLGSLLKQHLPVRSWEESVPQHTTHPTDEDDFSVPDMTAPATGFVVVSRRCSSDWPPSASPPAISPRTTHSRRTTLDLVSLLQQVGVPHQTMGGMDLELDLIKGDHHRPLTRGSSGGCSGTGMHKADSSPLGRVPSLFPLSHMFGESSIPLAASDVNFQALDALHGADLHLHYSVEQQRMLSFPFLPASHKEEPLPASTSKHDLQSWSHLLSAMMQTNTLPSSAGVTGPVTSSGFSGLRSQSEDAELSDMPAGVPLGNVTEYLQDSQLASDSIRHRISSEPIGMGQRPVSLVRGNSRRQTAAATIAPPSGMHQRAIEQATVQAFALARAKAATQVPRQAHMHQNLQPKIKTHGPLHRIHGVSHVTHAQSRAGMPPLDTRAAVATRSPIRRKHLSPVKQHRSTRMLSPPHRSAAPATSECSLKALWDIAVQQQLQQQHQIQQQQDDIELGHEIQPLRVTQLQERGPQTVDPTLDMERTQPLDANVARVLPFNPDRATRGRPANTARTSGLLGESLAGVISSTVGQLFSDSFVMQQHDNYGSDPWQASNQSSSRSLLHPRHVSLPDDQMRITTDTTSPITSPNRQPRVSGYRPTFASSNGSDLGNFASPPRRATAEHCAPLQLDVPISIFSPPQRGVSTSSARASTSNARVTESDGSDTLQRCLHSNFSLSADRSSHGQTDTAYCGHFLSADPRNAILTPHPTQASHFNASAPSVPVSTPPRLSSVSAVLLLQPTSSPLPALPFTPPPKSAAPAFHNLLVYDAQHSMPLEDRPLSSMRRTTDPRQYRPSSTLTSPLLRSFGSQGGGSQGGGAAVTDGGYRLASSPPSITAVPVRASSLSVGPAQPAWSAVQPTALPTAQRYGRRQQQHVLRGVGQALQRQEVLGSGLAETGPAVNRSLVKRQRSLNPRGAGELAFDPAGQQLRLSTQLDGRRLTFEEAVVPRQTSMRLPKRSRLSQGRGGAKGRRSAAQQQHRAHGILIRMPKSRPQPQAGLAAASPLPAPIPLRKTTSLLRESRSSSDAGAATVPASVSAFQVQLLQLPTRGTADLSNLLRGSQQPRQIQAMASCSPLVQSHPQTANRGTQHPSLSPVSDFVKPSPPGNSRSTSNSLYLTSLKTHNARTYAQPVSSPLDPCHILSSASTQHGRNTPAVRHASPNSTSPAHLLGCHPALNQQHRKAVWSPAKTAYAAPKNPFSTQEAIHGSPRPLHALASHGSAAYAMQAQARTTHHAHVSHLHTATVPSRGVAAVSLQVHDLRSSHQSDSFNALVGPAAASQEWPAQVARAGASHQQQQQQQHVDEAELDQAHGPSGTVLHHGPTPLHESPWTVNKASSRPGMGAQRAAASTTLAPGNPRLAQASLQAQDLPQLEARETSPERRTISRRTSTKASSFGGHAPIEAYPALCGGVFPAAASLLRVSRRSLSIDIKAGAVPAHADTPASATAAPSSTPRGQSAQQLSASYVGTAQPASPADPRGGYASKLAAMLRRTHRAGAFATATAVITPQSGSPVRASERSSASAAPSYTAMSPGPAFTAASSLMSHGKAASFQPIPSSANITKQQVATGRRVSSAQPSAPHAPVLPVVSELLDTSPPCTLLDWPASTVQPSSSSSEVGKACSAASAAVSAGTAATPGVADTSVIAASASQPSSTRVPAADNALASEHSVAVVVPEVRLVRDSSYGRRMLESLGEDVIAAECVGYIAAGITVTVQVLASGGSMESRVSAEQQGCGVEPALGEGSTPTAAAPVSAKKSRLSWLRCFKVSKHACTSTPLASSAGGSSTASFAWQSSTDAFATTPGSATATCKRDEFLAGPRRQLLMHLPLLSQLLTSSRDASIAAAGAQLQAHAAETVVHGFHFHKGVWHPDATIVLKLLLVPVPTHSSSSNEVSALLVPGAKVSRSKAPNRGGRKGPCVQTALCLVDVELKVGSGSAFACLVLGLNAAMHMQAGGDREALVNSLSWVVTR